MLGLLAGELLLQALSLFTSERTGEEMVRKGERRILCIGDSNTYGVHVEAQDSYPAQLQRMLERVEPGRHRVINLGWPGRNSAEARAFLREQIRRFRPEVCIVWIGINDTWSRAKAALWERKDEEGLEGADGAGWGRLRMMRLVRLLVQRVEQSTAFDALSAEGDGRAAFDREVPPLDESNLVTNDELRHRIMLDLERILAICREHGVRLVLCDYPIPGFKKINRPIQEFSAKTEVPLIDLEAWFLPLFEQLGFDRLMYKDAHPRTIGYHEIARLVLQQLIDLGHLAADPRWRAVDRIEALMSCLRIERSDSSLDPVRLRLSGPPGAKVVLTLWMSLRSRTGDMKISPIREPEQLGLAPASSGSYARILDASGTASFELRLPPLRRLSNFLDKGDDLRWKAISFLAELQAGADFPAGIESNTITIDRAEIERAGPAAGR